MATMFLPVALLRQQHRGECLAACAAMVLDFIGMPPVPYKRLVKLLEIESTFGTASSKIRNLERLGVHVDYRKGNLDSLYQQLQNGNPCIVFLKTGELPYWDQNTEHAVVVIGVDDEFVYVNDPKFEHSPIQVTRRF